MSGNEHKIVEKQELKHSDLLPVLDQNKQKRLTQLI